MKVVKNGSILSSPSISPLYLFSKPGKPDRKIIYVSGCPAPGINKMKKHAPQMTF